MIFFDGRGNSITVNQSQNCKTEISHEFSKTQIIGHGANTSDLFERYKSDGLKFIECDLIKTSDEVFITGHNNQETFNGEVLKLTEMTYDEIFATGYPVFKLEELVLNCKKFNMCLYLDIKFSSDASEECLTNLYKLIEKYGMTQNTVFGSLSSIKQAILKKLNDSLIFDTPMSTKEIVLNTVPRKKDGKLIIGHISATGKNPSDYKEVIEYAHEKGFKIYPWTLGTTAQANAWLNAGADWVMCCPGVTNNDIL